MMIGKYLLLGTNLGDKKNNILEAQNKLEQICLIKRKSAIYETSAWGKTDQPSFYNQVIEIDTSLTSDELLNKILEIESNMGRVRFEKWGARKIDIDILYFDSLAISKDKLTIPHPGIPDRKFTLVPLVELAPNFISPSTNRTNQQMLENLHDQSKVEKLIMQDSN